MKAQRGVVRKHRRLIALTGTLLAAVALSGCGKERLNDLQAGYENLQNLPVERAGIALQKQETRIAEGHPVLSLSRPSKAEPVSVPRPARPAAPPVPLLPPVPPVPPVPPGQFAPANNLIVSVHQYQLPVSPDIPVALPSQPAPLTALTAPAVPPVPAVEEAPAVMSSSLQCDISDIADPLREVVTALEKKSLLYATGPLTDCSGIFHRVVQGLKYRCPGKEFPSVKEYRDSRDLARWYYERGQLQLVENAEESTELLKPGAVLFFGRNGSEYRDFSVDDLLTPRKGIAHLGVVVKVHKNDNGQVVYYELFHGHGRKGETPASITDWHKRTPTRTGYPPFGNGRQQWVAIARI